jgi:hypothetical protein
MARQDRLPTEPQLKTIPAGEAAPQGELFARLALRQLPIMKYGPEDEAILTGKAKPTLH